MASILDTLDRPHLGTYRPQRRLTPAERIAKHVVVDSAGCHIWTGCVSNRGYGLLTITQAGYPNQTYSAHKAAFELARGRVPVGMVLDHLCRVPTCVNPDHLEAVTQRENTMRSPVAMGAINAAKTHCPAGHPYSPENTRVYVKPNTVERRCITCQRATARRASAKYAARKASVR